VTRLAASTAESPPSIFRLRATKQDPPPRASIDQHRRDRARQELADLAADLDRRGVGTFDMFLALNQRNSQLGSPCPSVLPFIRVLPGLERWEPLANWSARIKAAAGHDPASLAEGIPDDDLERVHRRRRATALADWLRGHGGSLIVEEVVIAAEAVCCRHLEEGETWED
jgi:hypothetical protein